MVVPKHSPLIHFSSWPATTVWEKSFRLKIGILCYKLRGKACMSFLLWLTADEALPLKRWFSTRGAGVCKSSLGLQWGSVALVFQAILPTEHSSSSMGSSKANVTDRFLLDLNLKPSFCTTRRWRKKVSWCLRVQGVVSGAVTFKEPFTSRTGFRGLASIGHCPRCCLFSMDIPILVVKVRKIGRTNKWKHLKRLNWMPLLPPPCHMPLDNEKGQRARAFRLFASQNLDHLSFLLFFFFFFLLPFSHLSLLLGESENWKRRVWG